MIKRRSVWMLLLMGLLMQKPLHATDMNFVITLDRADLQRRVEQLFPITREDMLSRIRLYNPDVILTEGSNRIGLRLHLRATAANQLSMSGFARVDGELRFLSKSGEFYLDNARVEELTLNDVPPVIQNQIRQVADAALSELLRDRAIYVLGQMGESKSIMGSDIKSVTVHDGRLLIEIAMP